MDILECHILWVVVLVSNHNNVRQFAITLLQPPRNPKHVLSSSLPTLPDIGL